MSYQPIENDEIISNMRTAVCGWPRSILCRQMNAGGVRSATRFTRKCSIMDASNGQSDRTIQSSFGDAPGDASDLAGVTVIIPALNEAASLPLVLHDLPPVQRVLVFGWTIEMQIKAARFGLRILEVPVPYRCRTGTSKISGTVRGSIKAGVKILYTIAKYRLTLSWPFDTRSRSEPPP